MLPLLIAVPMLIASSPAEAPPEFPVCPVSGYPYQKGSGVFLMVRGHRYWTCHSTHAEALANHPERYLDNKGVPKILSRPSVGSGSPPASSPR